MQIGYSRTGGFANIPLNVKLDTTKLSQEDQEKVTKLVAHCLNVFVPSEDPLIPDGHHYQLEVVDDGKNKKIELSENQMSDELQDLFSLVLKLSRS